MLDEAVTLPDDVASLQEMVRALFAERDLAFEALKFKTLELEKLKMQLAKLRRRQFGQSSEKLAGQIAQLELAIEEIEAGQAAVSPASLADPAETGGEAGDGDEADMAGEAGASEPAARRRPARRKLPGHLPRETVVHEPPATCPDCGGATVSSAMTGARCSNTCPATSR